MIINDFLIFAAVNYAYVGIVALFVILVIVFAVMAAKNWHWSNIVCLSLTAIAAAFAANGMATVFDQRTKAMKDFNKQEARLARSELDLEKATSGAILAESYEPGTLRYVDEKLSQVLIGRGRTWEGGTPSVTDQATYTYNYKFAPRGVDGDAEAAAIGLKDYRLFAFVETKLPGKEIVYADKFVGVFRVLDESATDLTLQLINFGSGVDAFNPNGTWTLYEKMPQDRRGVFREAIIAEGEANPDNPAYEDYRTLAEMFTDDNKPLDITLFRKVLKQSYLSPDRLGLNLEKTEDQAFYENVLDRYSFDGENLLEIEKWIKNAPNRIADTFVPLPRETFVKFRFKKETNDSDNPPVKVDEKGKLQNDGFFTNNGEAIVPQIQNNGDVEFKEKDIVFVDSITAEGYSRGAENINVPAFKGRGGGDAVEDLGSFYFRAVQNFPYEYGEIRIRGNGLVQDISEIGQSNQDQTKINKTVTDQLDERKRLLADATEDNVALQADFQMIESLRQKREKELEAATQEMARLRTEIEANYIKLRKRVLQLSQQAFAAR